MLQTQLENFIYSLHRAKIAIISQLVSKMF